MRRPLSRRTVLRGLLAGSAVSLPLPALEAMLGTNGDALASGSPLPTRFGLWFWGNGVKPTQWIPPTTGDGWVTSEELSPLADLTPYISPVTGCEIKTATHPHHSGMTGVLTGMPYYQLGTVRDTIVTTFAGPSVDQIAASHIGKETAFRSLEAGITWFRGTDEGSTFQHLSHNGPNNWNASEYDASVFFDRLFGGGQDLRRDVARASVLDAVRGQASALRSRLGAADQIRLEQYLDSVRQLEGRLEADIGACTPMDRPGSYPDVYGLEQIEEKNAIFSQMLALALACDLTRVFSVQFSTAGSGVIVWQVGATDSWHQTSHDEADPQPTVHAAVQFTMAQLGVFLRTLRDTPEGDGNLLDRCSILCTSELCDGLLHSNTEFPIMIAGRGDGRLRGGHHYRSGSYRNTSDAVLTSLWGAGVPVASFGSEGGYTTSVISELLT